MTEVGYRRPPASTRFTKGRSGNPRGRPRGRHNRSPYEAVLGQEVVLREEGTERRVTAAEAFLLYMTKRGLEGDGAAARSAMTAIEEARGARTGPELGPDRTFTIDLGFVAAGNVNMAMEPLGMATKLDRYRRSAHMMIEPWLVQAALARLGERQLSLDEQATVVQATRTPHKVQWPNWWQIRPDQSD